MPGSRQSTAHLRDLGDVTRGAGVAAVGARTLCQVLPVTLISLCDTSRQGVSLLRPRRGMVGTLRDNRGSTA